MLTQKTITTQNDYIEIVLPIRDRNYTASMITSSDTPGTATFKIQIDGPSGEMIAIGIYDSSVGANAAADSITGASKYGWTDIPGATKVRFVRTDANGGNAKVAVGITFS